jgi:hypothetical protein
MAFIPRPMRSHQLPQKQLGRFSYVVIRVCCRTISGFSEDTPCVVTVVISGCRHSDARCLPQGLKYRERTVVPLLAFEKFAGRYHLLSGIRTDLKQTLIATIVA